MSTTTATPTAPSAPVTTAPASTSSSAATSTSAAPSDTLLNSDGKSFVMFDQDWLDLQSFVASALQLPITQGDFTDKYGAFSDMNDVEACITNLQAIQGLATEMGDPTALIQKIATNPNYVSGPTPPNEIYGHCIWLAGQLSNAASNFQDTYQSLSQIYTGTPQENAASMREIVSSQGGMLDQANQMKQYTNDLQNKLSGFQSKFAKAALGVQTYFNESTNVMTDAQGDITTDEETIQTLQAQAADAHKLWKDYTIAATTTSVGVMVLSCGLAWPIAAGLGAGLGAAAAHEMSLYNQYMGEISADNQDVKKKNRLVLDLSSLNSSVAPIVTAINSFNMAIARIEGVWLDQNNQLTNIVNLDDKVLGDLPEALEKLDIAIACSKWQLIATNTENFTTNCLVTYSTTTQFPNPIPSQN